MYQIAVYEYRNGPLLYDFSYTANGPKFQTNKYGFGLFTFGVSKRFDENARIYRYKKIAHVEVNLGAKKIYEGRLEDIEFTDQGLNITAYGYIRAFTDIQCTDIWSRTTYDDWQVVNEDDFINARPDFYNQDTQNRIYESVKSDSDYTSASYGTKLAVYNVEYLNRPWRAVSFFVEVNATGSFLAALQTRSDSWSNAQTAWIATSSGNGSITVAINNDNPNLHFVFRPQTALFIGDDGEEFLKITNLRYGTTTSISGGRLYSDEIVKYILSGVNTLNTTQLSTSLNDIQSPLTDITNFEYEDITGLDVINNLTQIPDNQNRLWECKVFFDGIVKFQPVGYDARTWYVDVGEFRVSKNFDKISNKVRVKYGDERTSFLQNNTSIQDYGVTRESIGSISEGTSTEANRLRAALLSDRADNQVQSSIQTKWIRDSSRAIRSSIDVRSGDIIIIGNLPPNLFEETLTTFTVLETDYDLESGIMTIVPDQSNPELEILLSRINY